MRNDASPGLSRKEIFRYRHVVGKQDGLQTRTYAHESEVTKGAMAENKKGTQRLSLRPFLFLCCGG
jgi:hypothetical protein